MNNAEVGKAKSIVINDIMKDGPNHLVFKTILKKTTGNINVVTCDTCKTLTLKIIPFDNFVQIIDGKAEIIIDGKSNFLKTGQSIILPAHTSNILKGDECLKMISTIIKSGYEEVS